jgi:hypothetical protein
MHPESRECVVSIIDHASGCILLVDAEVIYGNTVVRLSTMTGDATSTGILQAYLTKNE